MPGVFNEEGNLNTEIQTQTETKGPCDVRGRDASDVVRNAKNSQ